jgi:hypothetical protein
MADATVSTEPAFLGIKEADLIGKGTTIPALPSAPSDPAQQKQFLDKIKEVLEVREGLRGNKLDSNITWRDLFSHGVVDVNVDGTRLSGAPKTPVFIPRGVSEDFSVPPAPTNLTANGAFENIILTWTNATFPSFAYTEIWRSDTDNLTTAAKIGTTTAAVYADAIKGVATKYYWIRFVNQNDVIGPFNRGAGTPGSTSDDPAHMMQVLSDAYGTTSQAPFFQIDTATTINGVSIPAGTYIKAAFIADATITNAKIKDAAVDNAKIANLDAAKINAGYLSADRIEAGSLDAKTVTIDAAKIKTGYLDVARIEDGTIGIAKIANSIQSTDYSAGSAGWKINKSGNAEFNNATFRGTLDVGGTTGSRLVIKSNRIEVWDGNVLRVQLGELI